MRNTNQSRRQFVATAGATCLLSVSHSHSAQSQESTGPIDCAFVQLGHRSGTHAQNCLASQEIIRRLCQLMDECAQWGAKIDIIVFSHLESLTLTAESSAIKALQNKAQALGTCLSFECDLATKEGGYEPVTVLIDSTTGLTSRLNERIKHVLKQANAALYSTSHDHIRYTQLPATVSDLIGKPMDSVERFVG